MVGHATAPRTAVEKYGRQALSVPHLLDMEGMEAVHRQAAGIEGLQGRAEVAVHGA
jgi:hypothetical protein